MAAILVRDIPGVGGVGDVEIDELSTLQAHNGPSRVWCRGRQEVFVIGPWLRDNGGTRLTKHGLAAHANVFEADGCTLRFENARVQPLQPQSVWHSIRPKA